MKTLPKTLAPTLALAAVALATPLTAQADYPEKPVEFVIPFPPGDLEDILTRMIADEFTKEYGVPAGVVNKPGGGGGPFPGAVEVANADADGYTVGSFVSDVVLTGPQIGIPALSPNPFEPIGVFVTYPFVIATSGDAPYSSIDELAAYAQDNEVALGHFGAMLTPTQITFALAKAKGFDFAYEAAFDALDCNSLASGDVDVMNTTLQLIMPCLDDVKVLASIGAERIPLTPDTPTVAEVEPALNMALWNGLFVKADVPQDARDKIAAVAEKVMASEAAKQLAADTGALIYWQDAAEAEAQIEADMETLATISGLLE
ncbi:Tripartite-type tricarboxylate transporter, receptor component TctC [Pseudooceanicola antarcticus]|uniref:Tripartite tricarboxylate transporter substrate binding protein n=1 Tax=Pseudooceanicola antarcticus TaxID=1247613 RepID=A0A285IM81_9RHOB|nr:tripartite tricarboxylate transporter substrate binding protein [Pseudooceanicola antarcticus]PJE28796.1 tripartite tricarboxylate transporter substrate binding protein [Pseudooceanicola antarcticus]SNY48216.1 Tripartite-type tricarboxylate transporter, receptor component TctC [Pseudooceanicola antarcticus]